MWLWILKYSDNNILFEYSIGYSKSYAYNIAFDKIISMCFLKFSWKNVFGAIACVSFSHVTKTLDLRKMCWIF